MMDAESIIIAVTTIATCAASLASLASAAENETPRRRPQPHFHRAALLSPIHSASTTAWRQILTSGSSSDFIAAINFDRRVFFDTLLPIFAEERYKVSFGSPYRQGPKIRGRPCSVSTEDILGLTLWRLKSCGRQNQLCVIFGLIPSTVSDWFNYGLKVLYRTLKRRDQRAFRVEWPDHNEMQESAQLLQDNRPNGALLRGVFGVIDGGRFPCADYVDNDVQNAFYEGYTCTVNVTNLLVYNFKGEIIHAAVNYPGTCHDSKLASLSGLVYPRLDDVMTPPGFALLGDSAFVTWNINGKIVRSRKHTEKGDIPQSTALAAVDCLLQRVMPSERQSAEWGIRALKAPFGILRIPLTADARQRYRLIAVCVRLLNIRTRLVGLNQIQTVYANRSTVVQPWVYQLVHDSARD